jgi:hypothetical protein
MLGTLNGNDIVFQGIPELLQWSLRDVFEELKVRDGVQEAVVMATLDGDLNLQLNMGPGRLSSLTERISWDSPARDFEDRVRRLVRRGNFVANL